MEISWHFKNGLCCYYCYCCHLPALLLQTNFFRQKQSEGKTSQYASFLQCDGGQDQFKLDFYSTFCICHQIVRNTSYDYCFLKCLFNKYSLVSKNKFHVFKDSPYSKLLHFSVFWRDTIILNI